MQPGDIVKMIDAPKDKPLQTWEIMAIKGDFRGIWIQIGTKKDLWHHSRLFEVVKGS